MENSSSCHLIQEKWDILIVLDACRYDLFERNYREFLDGTLEKHISVGIDTPTWLKSNFNEYYKNIIYISGNPYVNSKQVDFSNVGFNASTHFFKIIDVWDFGFDKFLNTVHPSEINKAFLKYYKLFQNKRFIIHYIQPHYPYISVEPKYIKMQKNEFANIDNPAGNKRFFKKLNKALPHFFMWKAAGFLQRFGYSINLGVGQIYLDTGWFCHGCDFSCCERSPQ